MKKYLLLSAAIMFVGSAAYAGYDISTERFPDGNNTSAPYTVTVEDTASDVVSTDYISIHNTTSYDTYLLSATKFAGLGSGATVAEIDRVADVSARLVTVSGTCALDVATHEGKILFASASAANMTCTLPAATGSGAKYEFVLGTVATYPMVIQVTGDDTMDGMVITAKDSGDVAEAWEAASDSDTLTFNSSTRFGAAIGGRVILQDIAVDQWAVNGTGTSTGSEATPFSAAVSP